MAWWVEPIPKMLANHISATLIQLSANAYGKEVVSGPSTYALPPNGETQMEFHAPGFGLAKPWLQIKLQQCL